MTTNALDLLYGLPQAEHFPDSRIVGYIQRLQKLGEDTLWHVNRLGGFGGSEMGALLRHRFGDFAELPDSSFKSAWEVVAEKLLRLFPRPAIDAALRGRELEPLIRDAFRLRFRAVPDEASLPLTQQHATIQPLRGSVDDLLIVNGRRILPDYKSAQMPFDSVPFDYRVQLHTYSAICDSNGLTIDSTPIVGLHAPEEVFNGLRKIVAERELNPKAYQRWVETLAFASVPGIELRIYPLKFNADLARAIENTADYYWREHVLQGRLIAMPQTKPIPEAILPQVEFRLAQAAHAIAAIKAGERIQAEAASTVAELLQKAEVPIQAIKWPQSLGSPRVTQNFDQSKALAAAMANGIDPEDYTHRVISIDRLKAKFVELGGDLNDETLNDCAIDNKKLASAIASAGMDIAAFQKPAMTINLSRATKVKEAITTMQSAWNERIDELTQAATLFETDSGEVLEASLDDTQASPALNPA